MKIVVKSKAENLNINIRVPMAVIITILRVCKPFIKIDYNKKTDGKKISEIFNTKDVDIIIKGLKYLNKEYKGLSLVDVEDGNGEIVKIQI